MLIGLIPYENIEAAPREFEKMMAMKKAA